jgi:hypothetical protein
VVSAVFFKILKQNALMNLKEIDAIARTYGIRANGDISKIQLIKSIQISQRNFPCIATAGAGECDQMACCWREDCFDAARET